MAGPVQAQPQKRKEENLARPSSHYGANLSGPPPSHQPLWQQVVPGLGLAPAEGEAEQTAEA